LWVSICAKIENTFQLSKRITRHRKLGYRQLGKNKDDTKTKESTNFHGLFLLRFFHAARPEFQSGADLAGLLK
jgi:hypothetical protein